VEGTVPVGEQKRDEQAGVEEDIDEESPRDKSYGSDAVNDTLSFGLVGLISQFEATRLQTLVSGAISLLHMLIDYQ
jgi:hypothetical protein